MEKRKKVEDAYRRLLADRRKPIILGGPDYEVLTILGSFQFFFGNFKQLSNFFVVSTFCNKSWIYFVPFCRAHCAPNTDSIFFVGRTAQYFKRRGILRRNRRNTWQDGQGGRKGQTFSCCHCPIWKDKSKVSGQVFCSLWCHQILLFSFYAFLEASAGSDTVERTAFYPRPFHFAWPKSRSI